MNQRGSTMDEQETLLKEARPALEAAASRTAELVRSASDLRARMPNSQWTVGDAAAHLVVYSKVYTDCLAGVASPVSDLAQLAQTSARLLAEAPAHDKEKLAELIVGGVDRFLDATAARRSGEQVTWHAGVQVDLAALVCISLGEHVLHGYDMAKALGRAWPIPAGDANLVLHGLTEVLPLFVDPERASGFNGTYDIQVRGGARFTARFSDGRLSLEPPGAGRIDCHVSADPVAFLLVAYGRVSQWGPIATAKMVAWGWKPWLGFKFKGFFVNP